MLMLFHKVWRHAMWRQQTKHDTLVGYFLNIFQHQKNSLFKYFSKGTACLQNLSYKTKSQHCQNFVL